MAKLLSSREIIAVLEREGFIFKSKRGSHAKYVRGERTVIVPHPKPGTPQGTFASIVRQSGLTKETFFH